MTDFRKPALAGAHRASDLHGREGFALNKWQLLRVIEDIREALGLKGTSIAVLRAMVSLVKGDAIGDGSDGAHVCFASNATLAKRAHVSVQTVERHVARLVSLGLVARQTAGNGKRWARRDGAGRVVVASGLSLLPLVARHGEFQSLARTQADTRAYLAALADRCRLALARLTDETLIDRARRVLRRKPDGAALEALLVEITGQNDLAPPPSPEKTRGSDTQIEGHKEPSLSQDKEIDLDLSDMSPDRMERAFPRLCADLRTARSHRECQRRMETLADGLQMSRLWPEIRAHGPTLAFMILGYILERSDRLHHPGAYARTLLARLNSGEMSARGLLAPAKAFDRPPGVR